MEEMDNQTTAQTSAQKETKNIQELMVTTFNPDQGTSGRYQ